MEQEWSLEKGFYFPRAHPDERLLGSFKYIISKRRQLFCNPFWGSSSLAAGSLAGALRLVSDGAHPPATGTQRAAPGKGCTGGAV